MVAGLEGLRIFRLAEKLSDEIWEHAITWKLFARDTIGRELVRAADSIGANIAEGHGRFHYREEMTFDYYARGPLKETRFLATKSSCAEDHAGNNFPALHRHG